MNHLERIAEEKIREAMRNGVFDDLPGKGRPLKLEDDPFTPEDERAAHTVLKQYGVALPWMERRREIEAELAEAVRRLQTAADYDEEAACREFRVAIAALNRKIFDYNLQVPAPAFQRRVLQADAEIEQALRTK